MWSVGREEYHWRLLPHFWFTRCSPFGAKASEKRAVLAPVATHRLGKSNYLALSAVVPQQFLRFVPSRKPTDYAMSCDINVPA